MWLVWVYGRGRDRVVMVAVGGGSYERMKAVYVILGVERSGWMSMWRTRELVAEGRYLTTMNELYD